MNTSVDCFDASNLGEGGCILRSFSYVLLIYTLRIRINGRDKRRIYIMLIDTTTTIDAS